MRCVCCNTNLNDYESTLRGALTGDFLNICRKCLRDLDIKVLPNTHEQEEAAPGDENVWDIMEDEQLWPNHNVDYDE